MKRSGVAWVFRLLLMVPAFLQLNSQVSVTTWHNDNWRTGENTNETQLSINSINTQGFGRLCQIPLPSTPQQEEAYAQPLVIANSDGSTTVYVATMQDNVYVFNVPPTAKWTPQTCAGLQHTAPIGLFRGVLAGQFPADVCLIDGGGGDTTTCTRAVCPSVGILGTPVIDTASNTMYLVTESQDANNPGPQGINCPGKKVPNFYHYLHALDLTSSPPLAEKNGGPVQINPPNQGKAAFESRQVLQRPGLLFLNGISPASPTVYLAFSMMDGTLPNPTGWVLAYDGGNLGLGGFPLVFATVQTPDPTKNNSFGGGIWQGGAGLAAGLDATNQNNYIYVSTADGLFDPSKSDYGDSFLKLTTDLNLAKSFTPSDTDNRWNNDLDFGSAGELIVPDGTLPAPFDHMVIKGDKEQYIWAIDRTNPSPVLQQLNIIGKQARSTAAFWNDGTNPFIYIAQQFSPLSQYKLSASCTGGPICTPAASTTNIDPTGTQIGYAATPSVSSMGNQNNGTGIVWAIRGHTNAPLLDGLYAFDAENLNTVLYQPCNSRDGITPTRFSVPTVANGYVFVGAQTDFDIFGLSPVTCQ